MDAEKTGRLIRRLREEKGMTQVQLGERMHISHKTVSKWETGGGAPDISLLPALGEVLGVEVKALLEGDMGEQPEANGNLRKMCFYVCPRCKRLLLSEGRGDINCCGQKLESLPLQKPDAAHQLTVSPWDGNWLLESAHPMERAHYISFAAFLTEGTLMLRKLYPEWDMQTRLPFFAHGLLLWYCTEHGLFYRNI